LCSVIVIQSWEAFYDDKIRRRREIIDNITLFICKYVNLSCGLSLIVISVLFEKFSTKAFVHK
jgi:hypothetical protein